MEYPATVDVRTPDRLARWRPLVQWLLAVPHFVVVSVLGVVAGVLALVSWVVILVTGRLPEGVALVQVMIVRYQVRVEAYAGYLHPEYPPFDFTMASSEPGASPVAVDVDAALTDRNRLTAGLRFVWVIPAALYAAVISIIGAVCWFLAFFAVVFTGRWPDGLRVWVMRTLRVAVRVNAYGLLLTDEYPPFSTE